MITFRPAQEKDFPAIAGILTELELAHPSIRPERFLLAIEDNEIAGVANLEDCGGSLYLSAVGVRLSSQGRGIARAMLSRIAETAEKEIYVYTRIPKFFELFGFAPANAPGEIPPRTIYDCEACGGLHECLCMSRKPDASNFS
ncbi:MAG TPA: GNAT family N-acetyltransferase [bacterium]|nr:GNAT family N-acetyltransferase [bacterium]